MNITDLIHVLEEIAETTPDATVLLAHQPSWPLQFEIGAITDMTQAAMDEPCEEHGNYNCDECADAQPHIVYIAEGDHPESSPYAPREAWYGQVDY